MKGVPLKVLFICFQVPYPLLKGYQARAYSQIMALRKDNEVDVVSLEYGSPTPEDIRRVRNISNSFHIVSHSRIDFILNIPRAICSSKPFQTSLFRSRALNLHVAKCLRAKKYDLVHVQLLRLAEVLKELDGVPTVVDYIDALSKNMMRRAALESWPLKSLLSLEGRRLSKYERRVSLQVAKTFIVSESDALSIGGAGQPTVVPLGINLEDFLFRPYENRADIIFCGNLSYFPNAKAALYLISKVMPRLWDDHPEVRLILAGAFPSSEIIKAASDSRIGITGFVDDLASYIAKAAVGVFPMQSGSGMQYKILEAMAVGTPVVTSSIAMSAFPSSVPHGVVQVADDLGDLISKIRAILAAHEVAATQAKAARAWIERAYSWDATGALLLSQYRGVLAG